MFDRMDDVVQDFSSAGLVHQSNDDREWMEMMMEMILMDESHEERRASTNSAVYSNHPPDLCPVQQHPVSSSASASASSVSSAASATSTGVAIPPPSQHLASASSAALTARNYSFGVPSAIDQQLHLLTHSDGQSTNSALNPVSSASLSGPIIPTGPPSISTSSTHHPSLVPSLNTLPLHRTDVRCQPQPTSKSLGPPNYSEQSPRQHIRQGLVGSDLIYPDPASCRGLYRVGARPPKMNMSHGDAVGCDELKPVIPTSGAISFEPHHPIEFSHLVVEEECDPVSCFMPQSPRSSSDHRPKRGGVVQGSNSRINPTRTRRLPSPSSNLAICPPPPSPLTLSPIHTSLSASQLGLDRSSFPVAHDGLDDQQHQQFLDHLHQTFFSTGVQSSLTPTIPDRSQAHSITTYPDPSPGLSTFSDLNQTFKHLVGSFESDPSSHRPPTPSRSNHSFLTTASVRADQHHKNPSVFLPNNTIMIQPGTNGTSADQAPAKDRTILDLWQIDSDASAPHYHHRISTDSDLPVIRSPIQTSPGHTVSGGSAGLTSSSLLSYNKHGEDAMESHTGDSKMEPPYHRLFATDHCYPVDRIINSETDDQRHGLINTAGGASGNMPCSALDLPTQAEILIPRLVKLDEGILTRDRSQIELKLVGIQSVGAKTRVETQIKLSLVLVYGSSGRVGVNQDGSLVRNDDGLRPDEHSLARIGNWSFIKLPAYSAIKRKSKKLIKIGVPPEQTLVLEVTVVRASEPHDEIYCCSNCQIREQKRTQRKRDARVRPAQEIESDEAEQTLTTEDERKKIVVFNCGQYVGFESGEVTLPTRITCYCRHHREKKGFCLKVGLRDHRNRLIGSSITPPIMITDDHKAVAAAAKVKPGSDADDVQVKSKRSVKKLPSSMTDQDFASPTANRPPQPRFKKKLINRAQGQNPAQRIPEAFDQNSKGNSRWPMVEDPPTPSAHKITFGPQGSNSFKPTLLKSKRKALNQLNRPSGFPSGKRSVSTRLHTNADQSPPTAPNRLSSSLSNSTVPPSHFYQHHPIQVPVTLEQMQSFHSQLFSTSAASSLVPPEPSFDQQHQTALHDIHQTTGLGSAHQFSQLTHPLGGINGPRPALMIDTRAIDCNQRAEQPRQDERRSLSEHIDGRLGSGVIARSSPGGLELSNSIDHLIPQNKLSAGTTESEARDGSSTTCRSIRLQEEHSINGSSRSSSIGSDTHRTKTGMVTSPGSSSSSPDRMLYRLSSSQTDYTTPPTFTSPDTSPDCWMTQAQSTAPLILDLRECDDKANGRDNNRSNSRSSCGSIKPKSMSITEELQAGSSHERPWPSSMHVHGRSDQCKNRKLLTTLPQSGADIPTSDNPSMNGQKVGHLSVDSTDDLVMRRQEGAEASGTSRGGEEAQEIGKARKVKRKRAGEGEGNENEEFEEIEPEQGTSPPRTVSIKKLIPNEGPMDGGVEITALGEGFERGMEIELMTGHPVTTEYWSTSTMVFVLPASSQAGECEVNIKGRQLRKTRRLTYIDQKEPKMFEKALEVVALKLKGGNQLDIKEFAREILNEKQFMVDELQQQKSEKEVDVMGGDSIMVEPSCSVQTALSEESQTKSNNQTNEEVRFMEAPVVSEDEEHIPHDSISDQINLIEDYRDEWDSFTKTDKQNKIE